METRGGVPVLAVAILCMATGSWAAENDDGSGAVTSAAVAAVAVSAATTYDISIEPWIHPSMDYMVREKLEAGFDLAIERVRDVPACAELFHRLGEDGIDMLRTGLYFPVDTHRREVEVCGRNPAGNAKVAKNLAYTTVGGAPTWICRHFSTVTDEYAAVTVIHEALHHAGLPEKPLDRTAMTSVQITEMVMNACDF
jgi:hypothetical protein